MKKLLKIMVVLFCLLILGGLAAGGAVFYGFWHFGKGLPDYAQLASYEPPVMTRVHAADGSLIAEYAREKRLFVPIEAIPKRVTQAFLAAEDQNFYEHFGIDLKGIARAMLVNVQNIGQGRRLVGASTITQQVAKNMLLTNEVSYERKAKEAILAIRIERSLPKDRILELYLNEIFLGHRAYGVAAAALFYFDKAMNELTVAEAAYLGALPKAPNNYNPFRFPDRALSRRNWVISRMLEEKFITPEQAEEAIATPLNVQRGRHAEVFKAEWFVEQVRRELFDLYGSEGLYDGGLSVRTTMQTAYQKLGEQVLRDGLRTYDRRHGWRGPIASVDIAENWLEALQAVQEPAGLTPWELAVVLEVGAKEVLIGLKSEDKGRIPFDEMKWARPWLKGQKVGRSPGKPSDVLSVGDVVAVTRLEGEGVPTGTFGLEQIPAVSGALVAMDPHTGRVHALVGGWSPELSKFNRAVQALRQPGSAFKPFVYAAALDNGFSPVDKVMDGPFVLNQPNGERWKPSNYTNRFYGPSTLRLGIEKSRNLMTVRLARSVGMDVVSDYAGRFGIDDNLQPTLAMSLGAMETTLLKMTTAYAELVNGGKEIVPTLIDRVQDRRGHAIYKHDTRPCDGCFAASWHEQEEPVIPDNRTQVISPATAYQVVSMLEGVVLRGTGRKVAAVGKPLAGKTGTTNDARDAWFVGFSPDLAVGIYVGFDNPRTLGPKEGGSGVASPIFRDFMAGALKDKPSIPFRVPEGIRLVRVNSVTGEPARPGDRGVILEAFKIDQGGRQAVLDGSDDGGPRLPVGAGAPSTTFGPGGLY
ncbi:penicillin-binding protein 1A [Sneathiella chinensis]|uniref:Penicillin-binding protein 1A n=1 Tax=Sneathiella chinensis TaxID=349750 RepID=A0ABQ5U5S3_9PROT|nr:penicillin-binding protein 1A [Sneathiella chinensis]GLQ07063.1 penicillin-binding protein 1A [Sneathiella chinensis]